MIIVKHDGYDIGVRFTHDNPGKLSSFESLYGFMGTDCDIFICAENSSLLASAPVSSGSSVLNPNDNFNKAVGRHVSFIRALTSAPFSSDVKREINSVVRKSCKMLDPKHVK